MLFTCFLYALNLLKHLSPGRFLMAACALLAGEAFAGHRAFIARS